MMPIPLYDDNPKTDVPVTTYLLIGLCTGAFLWELGHNPWLVARTYGMVPAEVFGLWRPPRVFQVLPPWGTIFTSMFLHAGWFHLIGNMLFLWIFGNTVENDLGLGRYLLLYFCCGTVAALTQAAASPASHVPLIGASGAIAGVLGAYLLLHPAANVRCFIWIVIFFRILNLPAWAMLGLWFTIQLIYALTAASGRGGVAFWAHVGGFLSGMVLVVVLRPSGVPLFQPRRSQAFTVSRPAALAGPGGQGSVPQAGRRRSSWS
jgi:membrane associated rhomboid family serine protease